MSAPGSIVIVGAGIGGVRVAQTLRRLRYAGPITIIGGERHRPYDRPPLSKAILLGDASPPEIGLLSEAQAAELDVELRLGVRAVGLDAKARTVSMDDGSSIGYGAAVIATGSVPRRLPALGGGDGFTYLRSLDDAVALRGRLVAGADVAVVGGGFIGGEIASAARTLGLRVTVIEAAVAPLAAVLGRAVGEAAADLYRRHGVDVRCQTTVVAGATDEGTVVLELGDGAHVRADVAVIGVGARPDTDWLQGSGVTLDDGVVCDAGCRAVGVDGIHAVGDVCRWAHPRYGPVRVEHWTNAVEQALAVAANLLADDRPAPCTSLPYFWSDQFGTRIQFVGQVRPGDEFSIIEGDASVGTFAGVYAREGTPVACVAFNRARTLSAYRRTLTMAPEPVSAG